MIGKVIHSIVGCAGSCKFKNHNAYRSNSDGVILLDFLRSYSWRPSIC